MRMVGVYLGLGIIAACGAAETVTLEQTTQARLPAAEAVAPSAPEELLIKPERTLGVRPRGEELDPADLGALARRAMTCGETSASEFMNEPRALELGRAKRNGDTLTLGDGGFTNPYAVMAGNFGAREPAVWEFHYFGVLKETGTDVLHAQYSEGDAFILADQSR